MREGIGRVGWDEGDRRTKELGMTIGSSKVRFGVAAAALVAASLGGCGSPDGGADGSPAATTTTQTSAEVTGLAPSGTTIADGLVVPGGARLAGAVFRRPSETEGLDDWSAYLVIDGDPFAVWDDLAGQVRDGTQPVALSGSADACTWMIAEDDLPSIDIEDEPGGVGSAIDESTAGSAPETAPPTTTALPQPPDPYLAAVTVTADEPAFDVDGVECFAAAASDAEDATTAYTMNLLSSSRWPATITIDSYASPDWLRGRPSASRTSLEMQGRPGGGPELLPGPDPVPDGAADHVPPAARQEAPEVGDPFGVEVNCFSGGRGYEHLDLPAGAGYVAGGFSRGSMSVISVPDAQAVIADIQGQVASDGTSDDGLGTVDRLTLADGGAVIDFSFNVGGGGGSCGARSSPDGQFLLVSMRGD